MAEVESCSDTTHINSTNFTCNSTIIVNENFNEMDYHGCIFYEFLVYTAFGGMICVFGIIGNLLSFTVFQKDTLKTSTTFLFQGLAITDSFLLITAIPVYCLKPLLTYCNVKEYEFLIHPYILVYVLPWAQIAQTAAIWVTVLVGVNRYIAVCLPYQASRLCSVAKARLNLAIVLLFSFVYNIPHFATTRISHRQVDNRTIPIADHNGLGNNPLFGIIYYNICYLIFMLLVPLLILIVLNIRLIKTLKELKRRRAEMQTRQQQQDNNVTFVLIIVLLVFSVCQVPALITQIFWSALPDSSRACGGFQYYWSPISNSLVLLNSGVNFVIYICFNKRFRQVMVQQVCWCTKARTNKAKANGSAQATLLTQV